jgi:hypothetical protein
MLAPPPPILLHSNSLDGDDATTSFGKNGGKFLNRGDECNPGARILTGGNHFKLDRFVVKKKVHGANVRPCLKLKTRPSFGPARLSLSVMQPVTNGPISYFIVSAQCH